MIVIYRDNIHNTAWLGLSLSPVYLLCYVYGRDMSFHFELFYRDRLLFPLLLLIQGPAHGVLVGKRMNDQKRRNRQTQGFTSFRLLYWYEERRVVYCTEVYRRQKLHYAFTAL